ncbi:L-lactate permease [Mongoliimonas terrestris]|uniref:L-lactate permease n=1 Tax=Mongoliimonas terrestris TaxID=1709001 RepID=UPI000949812C|nr:L-lactate permease [Mongoliimonas terrestris]
MPVLLAAAPILLILITMTAFRWTAAFAGGAALAVTVPIALFAFGYGAPVAGEGGRAVALAGAFAEAGFVTATVIWIIFPALCIYEAQVRGGAFDTLRAALARLSDDPRILALLVAWFFALFMEGVAGFGTPVALAAPLLVTLGFQPVAAVTLVLIGHAAGVSFGAVGTPVVPLEAASGLDPAAIAAAMGLMHGLLGWILLVFVVRIAGAAMPGANRRPVIGWATLAAAAFLVPFLAIAWFVGPELPTVAAALLGGLAFAAAVRWRSRPSKTAANAAPSGASPADGPPAGVLVRAAAPYLVLLVLVLATRLVPDLQALTRSVTLSWTIADTFRGTVQPLHHPGTLLFAGFLLGGLLQGRGAGDLAGAARAAALRLPLVVLALFAMLGIARLMMHAGMVDALSSAAAAHLGPAWPLLAPLIGILGTFVTGSSTASNILFADFQAATAAALGLPVLWIIAAQGFGSAVGNIVCPHNIIAGAATVGLKGGEGEVLKRTLVACALYALAGGVLTFVIVSL